MTTKSVPAASPHLIRLLIQQNETALRGLRSIPRGEDGKRRMTIDEIARQTEALKARLSRLENGTD